MSVKRIKLFFLVFALSLEGLRAGPVVQVGPGHLCATALVLLADASSQESSEPTAIERLVEHAADFPVMDIGDYFNTTGEDIHFAYVSVFPRLIKDLRDHHHLTKADVNDLLMRLKVDILKSLAEETSVEFKAAFADYNNLRIAFRKGEQNTNGEYDFIVRVRNRINVAIKNFERDIKEDGGPLKEILESVKNQDDFYGWGVVSFDRSSELAGGVGRFVSVHPELHAEGENQSQEIWETMVQSLLSLESDRKEMIKVLKEMEATTGVSGLVVQYKGQEGISLEVMDVLRKTPDVELKETFLARFGISDQALFTKKLADHLIAYRNQMPGFEPPRIYRPQDIVHLEDVSPQMIAEAKQAKDEADYIVITDVKGVGANHLFEEQFAFAKIADQWRNQTPDYSSFVEGMTYLAENSFGASLPRLQQEMDRSEVLPGNVALSGKMVFTDFSGDERVQFYKGDMPLIGKINRFRFYLGTDQRAIIISLRDTSNERISDHVMSLLEERAFWLSKKIEEDLGIQLFTIEANRGVGNKMEFRVFTKDQYDQSVIKYHMDEVIQEQLDAAFPQEESHEGLGAFARIVRNTLGMTDTAPSISVEIVAPE